MQRWLKEAGLTPPPALLVRPGIDRCRACQPHQVWQMDAVEGLKLKDGSGACWLRISDEFSGAVLATHVFAQYRWAGVPAAATQEALRQALGRWGRPAAVRVDNGIPWGRPGGLPSALSLWLAGLGICMHWNDPYSPQQNGVVESTQGVSQRWVQPRDCGDLEELRRRVQREDYVQRHEYPAIAGLSRWAAYPGLWHSGRGYAAGCETYLWDRQEALGFLGRYQVRRKVSKRGQVSAYHRLIQVGQQYGGNWVYLGLDAQTTEWVIREVQGGEIRRRPAPEFTQEAMIHLSVARC